MEYGGSPLPATPWSVEELDACFVVKDSAVQKHAYCDDRPLSC
jgi:hypothetical protein